MAASSSSAAASLRQRPAAASTASPAAQPQQQQAPAILLQNDDEPQPQQQESPPVPPPQLTSSSPSALSQALASTANLANLLPTGTLLAFNLLAPTFTNHGACDGTTSLLTQCLLAVLALATALACFTDSLTSPHDGRVYHGVATPRGLWLIDYPPAAPPLPEATLRGYRLAFLDLVHAALSAAVFAVVAARDRDVVACLLGPSPDTTTKELVDVLPLGVGVLCSLLFVAFPTRRHGIGYPVVAAANAGAAAAAAAAP